MIVHSGSRMGATDKLPLKALPERFHNPKKWKQQTSADERKARVVECRFFGGMTIKETSEALGVSIRTVNRDWDVASAWLKNELEK